MATLVSIISTLALLVIMAAEMGHTQKLNCGNIPPIAGPWSNISGTYYIQQTYSPSGYSSIRCASVTCQPTANFIGQSYMNFTLLGSDASQTQTSTWTQTDQLVQLGLGIANLGSQSSMQVLAIGLPTNQTSVNSVVYKDANGYIMTSCPVVDGTKVMAMTKVIFCTKLQIAKTADVNTLAIAATKLGIDIIQMAPVDQTTC